MFALHCRNHLSVKYSAPVPILAQMFLDSKLPPCYTEKVTFALFSKSICEDNLVARISIQVVLTCIVVNCKKIVKLLSAGLCPTSGKLCPMVG